MINKKIIIAIDGFSSSGKSTLAKDIAKHFNYKYIDTGAMYRAITLFILEKEIDIADNIAVEQMIENIKIDFISNNGKNETFLNGKNVEQEIRTLKVSNYVSIVAAIKQIRTFLVKQQREIGKNKGLVMDGRDIGTVVFPDAEIKFFVNADFEERTRRRFNEMLKKNLKISIADVIENLSLRDKIDSTRDASPLKKASDAIEIDNTNLNRAEQLTFALEKINEIII